MSLIKLAIHLTSKHQEYILKHYGKEALDFAQHCASQDIRTPGPVIVSKVKDNFKRLIKIKG